MSSLLLVILSLRVLIASELEWHNTTPKGNLLITTHSGFIIYKGHDENDDGRYLFYYLIYKDKEPIVQATFATSGNLSIMPITDNQAISFEVSKDSVLYNVKVTLFDEIVVVPSELFSAIIQDQDAN